MRARFAYVERLLMGAELANMAPRLAVPLRVATAARMAFLPKPFTPEALARKVRDVLNGPASAIPSLPLPGGVGVRVPK